MQFKSRMDFFKGLSNVMDSRDKYTEGHSSRVANIARLIGSRMKLDDRQLDNLYQAGLLHDIGKIGIPDNILKKHDKLDPAEYELIKKHPLISESIMGDIEAFREIHDAVKHHHEKMDGTGYPDRLKGSEIPVFSRIISIADALDAMTSHRGYSNKKNIKEAISIIETMAGTQFDPEIVMILAPLADSLDSLSETNSTFEIDPVCKMKITPATAAKKLRTRDGICYFCSKDCYNIYIKKFR